MPSPRPLPLSAALAVTALTLSAGLLTGTPAHAAATALPTGFATVMNAASGRCLDAEAADCHFNVNPGVVAAHAIEAPNNAGVRFTSMVTVSLGDTGTISHVINNTGGPSDSGTNLANLTNYS